MNLYSDDCSGLINKYQLSLIPRQMTPTEEKEMLIT